LPAAIFEPDPLITSTRINFNGGENVVFDIEAGRNVYASHTHIGSIYVYERDCRGGGKKAAKGTKKPKGQRNLKKAKKMGKKTGGDCEGGAKYGAIMVDCPPDFGPNMGTFVRNFLESIDAELEAMIVSHEHYDHVGNLNSVQEGSCGCASATV
jgi:hypothetical protein